MIHRIHDKNVKGVFTIFQASVLNTNRTMCIGGDRIHLESSENELELQEEDARVDKFRNKRDHDDVSSTRL